MDILDSIKEISPEVYKNINYKIVEISHKPKDDVLKDHIDKVEWYQNLDQLPSKSVNGIIISNEFFDALPYQRLKKINGMFCEIFLGYKDKNFTEEYVELQNTYVKNYIDKYCKSTVDNQEIEFFPEAPKIYEQLNNILSCGYLLTIDYGYLSDELYSVKRMKGTYRCFYNHNLNTDPYSNIGNQDITADINFSYLLDLGEYYGLENVKYINQGQFLVDWGILKFLEQYNKPEDQNHRLAIKNLIMPELMGSKFKVLIQSKNLNPEQFYTEGELKLIKYTL